jgi:thioredoxin-like negative regulator of GroEL
LNVIKAICFSLCLSSTALAAGNENDAKFLAELQKLDNGHAAEAIPALEALYAETKAPRVRLELARAYLFAGMKEKARDTFIAAYEDNPPPGVKSTILNFRQTLSLVAEKCLN